MQKRNSNRKDESETRKERGERNGAEGGREEDGEAISVGLRRCGFR